VAIWSLDSGNRLAPQTAPLGDLAWADWAPEHRIYVTISPDGIACIVDDSSGREVRRFETGARQLTSATLSADGRRVALGTRGGDIAVWDLLEAAEPTRIKRYGTLVHSLRFSPDGGRLLSADYSKAHLWNASTGERLFDFDGHEPLLQAAAMSSDGRRVATVADDRRAIVWDALSGDKLRVFPVEASKLVGVHFSGNGRRLVTTSINGTASVWDLETDTEIEVLRGHQGKVVKAAFTSDGRRVVTSAAGDASVALWDVDRRAVPRFDHKRYVNAFDLSTDGTRLLVSDRSGNTVIWDSAGGSRIGTLSGHRGEIISCRLSRDGRRAVTSSQDRTTRLWDVETGRVLRKYPAGRGFQGAQLGPDGRWIAVLSADGSEVLIADAESGDTLQSLMTDSRETTCFGFSPDGELVWAATKQGVILWRRATGERLSVLRGHEEHIRSVRFHPGGGLVVTASQDKSARVWELPAAKERCTLVHSSGVFSAAIHPAGDRVLTRSADEVARVWDAQSGALLLSLRSHEARLIAAVYAPDGRWVLTTSFDHTARLWDAATGEEFLTFRGHSDRLIGSVCFTPDGRSAITGSLDGTVRIWPLDPVALARLYTPRSFFPGEREKYGIGADTK
jgi:WD40 repeat protein